MFPTTRRALTCLALIALALHGLDHYYWDLFAVPPSHFSESVEKIEKAWREDSIQMTHQFEQNIENFNPNAVDSCYLQNLGLAAPLAQNWHKYLLAGGYFRVNSDILKIYGMDSAWFMRVKSYLVFPAREPNRFKEKSHEALKIVFFNPNTVTKEALEAMHLMPGAVQGILAFRAKYRPFLASEDIFKVYQIDSSLAQQLRPFILIDSSDKVREDLAFPKVININTADSMLLSSCPYIGAFRAQRMVEWRQRLGGFHSSNQLADHGILDSLALSKLEDILVFGPPIKKIKLNQDSLQKLQSHPYINYYLARNIVDFREKVRLFENVAELRNIELVNGVLFSKLAPYLEVSLSDTIEVTPQK